jgi:4-hydroxy-tetrahydrodipicolinate reductase
MQEITNTKSFITSDRIDDVPGTHIISYTSAVDEIEIKHTAKNRDGFAMGAIIAADWIIGKKGVFSMKDVLEQ